jgi:hypothetical protein
MNEMSRTEDEFSKIKKILIYCRDLMVNYHFEDPYFRGILRRSRVFSYPAMKLWMTEKIDLVEEFNDIMTKGYKAVTSKEDISFEDSLTTGLKSYYGDDDEEEEEEEEEEKKEIEIQETGKDNESGREGSEAKDQEH